MTVAVTAAASCTGTNNNAPLDAGKGSIAVYFDGGPELPPAVDSSPATEARPREIGYLWFAGGALGAFTKDETLVNSDHGPGYLVVPATTAKSFHDLAFDRDGNLWTVPLTGDQIVRLPASQLGLGTAPPFPDLTITSPALKRPQSLVFDTQGNLWVLNYDGSGQSVATVVRFDNPARMTGSVVLTPTLVIDPGTDPQNRARFSQGTSIAFDGAGNLWLSAVSNVLRLDRATTLSGAVTAAPSAIVSTGDAYASLAFDSAGSLWITAAAAGYLALRIANPASLNGAVSPAPSARVHLPTGNAMFASGMGFDADGSLWIAMSTQVVKIASPGTLSGDVTPTPAIVLGLVSFPDLASKVALWPRTAGLPGT